MSQKSRNSDYHGSDQIRPHLFCEGSEEELKVDGRILRDVDQYVPDGGEGRKRQHPGAQFNRKLFGLSFGLKNHLSFGLRFPTIRKCSKMGSLDMSQSQN